LIDPVPSKLRLRKVGRQLVIGDKKVRLKIMRNGRTREAGQTGEFMAVL
jgi:hypothetical protein